MRNRFQAVSIYSDWFELFWIVLAVDYALANQREFECDAIGVRVRTENKSGKSTPTRRISIPDWTKCFWTAATVALRFSRVLSIECSLARALALAVIILWYSLLILRSKSAKSNERCVCCVFECVGRHVIFYERLCGNDSRRYTFAICNAREWCALTRLLMCTALTQPYRTVDFRVARHLLSIRVIRQLPHISLHVFVDPRWMRCTCLLPCEQTFYATVDSPIVQWEDRYDSAAVCWQVSCPPAMTIHNSLRCTADTFYSMNGSNGEWVSPSPQIWRICRTCWLYFSWLFQIWRCKSPILHFSGSRE